MSGVNRDREALRSAEVLTAHGMDNHEFTLLYHVWMEQAPREEFVIYVRNLDNLSREQLTIADHAEVPEYVAALDRLIARGWVVILGEAEIENEQARIAAAGVPELIRRGRVQPGWVDYSPSGYAMKRQIVAEIYGAEFLARQDSGWNVDDEQKRFDIYASDIDRCRQLMDQIERSAGSYAIWARSAVTRVEKRGPLAIGPWKPNRFLVLQDGFHGVLRYGSP
jgi:hypothetical protein